MHRDPTAGSSLNHRRVEVLELCSIALRDASLMDTDDLRFGYKLKLCVSPPMNVDRSIPYSTSEYDEQTGPAFLLDR